MARSYDGGIKPPLQTCHSDASGCRGMAKTCPHGFDRDGHGSTWRAVRDLSRSNCEPPFRLPATYSQRHSAHSPPSSAPRHSPASLSAERTPVRRGRFGPIHSPGFTRINTDPSFAPTRVHRRPSEASVSFTHFAPIRLRWCSSVATYFLAGFALFRVNPCPSAA